MSERLGRAFLGTFARREIEGRADRRSFERGVLYAENGRVGKKTVTATSVKANVRGSSSYQVKLWLEDEQPAYDCSCPVGQEGRFCKHAVALALVVTDAVADPKQRADAAIDVRGYLESVEPKVLVDLLVERAAEDELFDARLRMDAARASGGPANVAVFRHAIDEAFMVGHYVGYRDMYDYAANIDAVLDSLRDLLDDGHAEAVRALAEHAVDRAEDALGYVDDSDGWMSTIAERLGELHRDACLLARPDPIELARSLFDRERHSGDMDVFHSAAATYADALGAEGIAEYGRLARAEWETLPPLGPDDERSWSGSRFRITHIMETLAELTGDVDAQVDVLSRNQSSAYQFVRIVELYRDAKRYDDALTWAEKGLALHGGADSRLLEATAQEYHRAGRGEDAVRIAWEAYDASPQLRTYTQLEEQAVFGGLWNDWHDRALALLRERVAVKPKRAQPVARGRSLPAPGLDGSTLVDVLLHDGDVEVAWVEANTRGCRRDLWLRLAALREGEHPLEAIPIWQEEIARRIDAKNNQAYAEAVDLIARVTQLMRRADREADVAPYLTKLRTAHKPKRNLMTLFDRRGW